MPSPITASAPSNIQMEIRLSHQDGGSENNIFGVNLASQNGEPAGSAIATVQNFVGKTRSAQSDWLFAAPKTDAPVNALRDAIVASGLLALPAKDYNESVVPAGSVRVIYDGKMVVAPLNENLPAPFEKVIEAMNGYRSVLGKPEPYIPV